MFMFAFLKSQPDSADVRDRTIMLQGAFKYMPGNFNQLNSGKGIGTK